MPKFSNHLLPKQLTTLQEEVLIGSMLGDGSLELAKTSTYPRLKIDRQITDKDYLLWEHSIFENLCSKYGIMERRYYDKRYDKTYYHIIMRTRAVPAFLPYYEQWYPEGKKIVPENLKLTPMILAVLLADDGCIVRNGKRSLTLKISVEGFGKAGAGLISRLLSETLGGTFPIYQKIKNRDLWFIKASTDAAIRYIKYITPVFHMLNMDRKLKACKDLDIYELEGKTGANLTKLSKDDVRTANKHIIKPILNDILFEIKEGIKLDLKIIYSQVVAKVKDLAATRTINGIVFECIKESKNVEERRNTGKHGKNGYFRI